MPQNHLSPEERIARNIPREDRAVVRLHGEIDSQENVRDRRPGSEAASKADRERLQFRLGEGALLERPGEVTHEVETQADAMLDREVPLLVRPQ